MAGYNRKKEKEDIDAIWNNKDYTESEKNLKAADYYAILYADRPDFNFDYNSDALYNDYKKQYQQNAQKAMQDTLGQAAALTGGYSSSYAQTAAQRSYDNTMQGLNDKIPELYQLALDRYNNEQARYLEKGNYYAAMAETARANEPANILASGYNAIAEIAKDYDGDLSKDAQSWYNQAKGSSDPVNEFLRLAANNGVKNENGEATLLYDNLLNDEAAKYKSTGWGIFNNPAEFLGSEWWYRLGRAGDKEDDMLNDLGISEYSRSEYNAMSVLTNLANNTDAQTAIENYINKTGSREAVLEVIANEIPNVKKKYRTAGKVQAIEDDVLKIIQDPNFAKVYKKYLSGGYSDAWGR